MKREADTGRFQAFDGALVTATHKRATLPIVRALLLRLHVLDRVAIGLLATGLLCVATGLLPTGSASDAMTRIAPLLAFLGTVIVLAELTSRAGVFDVVAARVARAGKGS